MTHEEIRLMRTMYYSDYAYGSDSLFTEAWRMREMGEPGWEEKLEAAKARFLAIQAEWPWPEEPQEAPVVND